MTSASIVERWTSAWNRGDMEGLLALYSPNVVYNHPMLPGPVVGIETVKQFVLGMASAFSGIEVKATTVLPLGRQVAAEVTHAAIHSGALQGPDGVIPATGKRIELRTAHFFTIGDDGLIAAETQYANPMALMSQLGVA